MDACAEGLTAEAVLRSAVDYEAVIVFTSTPTVSRDARLMAMLKESRPATMIGVVGPHVTVFPEQTLHSYPFIDFVAFGEFDRTLADVSEGIPFERIKGLAFRRGDRVVRNAPRPLMENLDVLPFVTPVYARDLHIENYYNGFLLHPYISLFGGRGCRWRCTFCLWPQTITDRNYRVRSKENICEEIALAKDLFPAVKEFFFNDDTFTDHPQLLSIGERLGQLGVTWSCNARETLSEEQLRSLKSCGLRCMVLGIESGNEQIRRNVKKGIPLQKAAHFSETAQKLGIRIHATFVLGLPGETRETIEETIRFVRDLDPYSMQVSLAAPYPGTELYEQARNNGWLKGEGVGLGTSGIQDSAISFDHLAAQEIFEGVERVYRSFYLRPKPIARMLWEMLHDRRLFLRRLKEGREFFFFLGKRERDVPANTAMAPGSGH
jgi:radical SAM superfamily enzyme YgiQ (UPF0313 family)